MFFLALYSRYYKFTRHWKNVVVAKTIIHLLDILSSPCKLRIMQLMCSQSGWEYKIVSFLGIAPLQSGDHRVPRSKGI